jgi:hypothetical protein
MPDTTHARTLSRNANYGAGKMQGRINTHVSVLVRSGAVDAS